jgi:cytochrome P450
MELMILVIIILVVCLCYIVSMALFNGAFRSNKKRPPLITGYIPFVGVAFKLGTSPVQYIHELYRKYGEVFTIVVMGKQITYIANPHDYHKIYANQKTFSFEPIAAEQTTYAFGAPTLDQQLVDLVHRQLPTFLQGEQPLKDLTSRMQQKLEHYMFQKENISSSEWKKEGFYNFITRIIFSASVEALYGDGIFYEKMIDQFKTFDNNFHYIAAGVPPQIFPSSLVARDTVASTFILEYENSSALMSERRNAIIDVCTPIELGRYQYMLLWALQANTIPATFWTIANLIKQPKHILQEIVEEIEQVVGKVTDKKLPALSPSDLAKMVKLDSCINETLRLSAFTMSIREVMADNTFVSDSGRKYLLKKGDRVVLSGSSIHYDPEVYENPTEFQYDRYIRNKQFFKNGKSLRQNIVLLPFGGGSSYCPGRYFARNEIKLCVAMILLLLDFRLVNENQELPKMNLGRVGFGILPPSSDIQCEYKLKNQL